jgi:hypothetical protein
VVTEGDSNCCLILVAFDDTGDVAAVSCFAVVHGDGGAIDAPAADVPIPQPTVVG